MMEALYNLHYLTPEWIVCGTVLVLILARLLGVEDRRRLTGISALGVLCSLFWTVWTFQDAAVISKAAIGNGLLQVDIYSQTFKLIFLVSTLAAVLFSAGSVEINARRSMEFNCFLLGLLSGMMFLASSIDMAMAYLAFEMMSLSGYILAGFTRGDPRSSEAGYKYVLFGAVSSGVMLFGLSLLYGMTGTMNLNEIGALMASGLVPYTHLFMLPIVLVLVGIGYKVAFFPFHYWAPDVYEGSPTPVTAFFSVGPKAAGFAFLMRLALGSLSLESASGLDWMGPLLALIAALTMTVGNLAALNQENVKRMLAYSAVAHAGYLMMGIAVLNEAGAQAVLFYLFAYLFMNLGAFTVIIALFNSYHTEQVDELEGVSEHFPLATVCMAVCLFSLTGLPPTAGFIGKFYLFSAVIDAGYYWLAVAGAVNTVLSLFYYMRLMKVFCFRPSRAPADSPPVMGCGYKWLIASLTAPVLVFGVCWSGLVELCASSISVLMIH